ncbi:hypothetical protein [Aggregatilinea lenta]|uniref:hypothetical protein n=1 Tax=Aggregatilinea lenta TaxID=913108 RepID=UPI000E5A7301|nr:hypothetical protein [Aggregatilinea lenta]
MPISDVEIDKPENAYLVCSASDTVLDALRAWRNTPNAYEWWWLVIDYGDQHYNVLRFEALRDLLTQPDYKVGMDTELGDLPCGYDNPDDWSHPFVGAYVPDTVDQNDLSAAQAMQQVRNAPGQILIVLNGSQLRGILTGSQRTFTFTDKHLLDMLSTYEQAGTPPAPPSGTASTADPAAPDATPSET